MGRLQRKVGMRKSLVALSSPKALPPASWLPLRGVRFWMLTASFAMAAVQSRANWNLYMKSVCGTVDGTLLAVSGIQDTYLLAILTVIVSSHEVVSVFLL